MASVSVATPLPSVSVYSFGKPMETGAFTSAPSSWKWGSQKLPSGCTVTPDPDEKSFTIHLSLGASDKIVGLGQHVGPVNCRGSSYRLFSTDSPVHIPSLRSMYGVHPFLVILRDQPLGVFVDAPGEIVVDAGASDRHSLSIKVSSEGFFLSLISGATPTDICRSYLGLTGTSFVPPRWAFGYHQSRWSYGDEKAVREIASQMEAHDIPCDVIHMDIHYMQDYKVFTVDKARFPDVRKMSAELREKGIRLISILDPGVKVEKGFSVYEEGKNRGFFCQRTDGKGDFVGAVWPGPSVFPDFFREEVRQWWGELYKPLLAEGFAGFWNDMNEPSIFYTPDAFKEFAKKIHRFDIENDFSEELANTLWDKGVVNRESYYDDFVHTVNGEHRTNREVHNLFGTQMTKSVADMLSAQDPHKRYFLLSRSSYPGMHRYAAIWMGDNHSWWEHLSLNIQMLISLNMSGFLFVGADTGGFSGDCTPEMLVRWTQLGAFTPFLRNHAAMWAKNQEPWSFGPEALELSRKAIKMRYALLPYIYTEFIRSACTGEAFIRGLFLDFKEAEHRLDNDQFLCGRSLLVAPVTQPAVEGRMVYLPSGSWLKVSGDGNGLRGEHVTRGGDYFVSTALHEIPLYMKLGSMIPMTESTRHTSAECPSKYTLLAFTDSSTECDILLDDGETRYDTWRDYPKMKCKLSKQGDSWSCDVAFENSPPRKLSLEVEVWSSSGTKQTLSLSK